MSNLRRPIGILVTGLLMLLLGWQIVNARQTDNSANHPAQTQLRQIQNGLIDSEAESVLGAYIPGVGAVTNMTLVRGPNALPEKSAVIGVQDWLIYLMQTFGSQLTAVSDPEKIIFSVDYYDYTINGWQQMVMQATASTISNPTSYQIWLNGQPLHEPDLELGIEPDPTPIITEESQQTPPATITPPIPEYAPVSGAVVLDLTEETAVIDWLASGGDWEWTSEGYRQNETERFDLISFYPYPIASNTYTIETDMKYMDGRMGGGLIFNATALGSKETAQMVSYTADGTYLQWGYFDDNGIHQFQGGTLVETAGSDTQWHTLTIVVTNGTYTILLDNVELASNLPLYLTNGRYSGLLVSNSQVLFRQYSIQTTSSE